MDNDKQVIHQDMCEKEAEIEGLVKDIDKLKEYPMQVAELKNEVSHITKAVDTMCLEIQKLTSTIQQLALVQERQDTLKEEVSKLVTELKESNNKMAGCAGRCTIDMTNVNIRINKVGERLTSLERIMGVIEWAVAIVGGAFLVSGAYFVWTLIIHIYGIS